MSSGELNFELRAPCGLPCQREWVIRIPDRYVSSGAIARKVMDLGEMNLEVELEDENQHLINCLHRGWEAIKRNELTAGLKPNDFSCCTDEMSCNLIPFTERIHVHPVGEYKVS
ncbi:unnamed protein product [Litomosoides sigmodontis]|uniref:Uncharacterized protein n=1 Tax=Litomosoides sigmodontis TaxID=42156 RepID=A0A3P6V0H3_LITSI|nr:unnamed protein product [Litomosoides sigmodontis]